MSTSGHLKFQGTNRATFVGTTSNIMFDTTSTSLGIGVTGTDHPSSNLYVTGNAYVSSNIAVGGVLTMGTVNVVARHDLEAVTALGNTTPVTLEFTNPTTSLVASGNVEVGGNVTVSENLTVSGNATFSGTGAITVPVGTTAQQPSTGLVGGMIRFNSTVNKLQVYNGTAWQSVGGVSATGGTATTSGGYKIHAFTSSGTFTVVSGGYMDILIVAGGGGGGGGTNSGGGGAGGVLLARDLSIGDGSYNIVVGDGGAAPYANGTNGSSSSFDAYSANGGGGGGEYQTNGLTGGNGGGAGADDRSTTRYGGGVTAGSTPSGFTKYGYSGGGGINGTSNNRAGGGGGGAGGAGGQANGSTPGSGGAGIDLSATFGTTLGESGYFASGGHGQSRQNAAGIYAGPVGGGGGNGSSRAGLPNTGGGGHGGYMNDSTNTGEGGSGIVIIRYLA